MPANNNMAQWLRKYPELTPVIELKPTIWLNEPENAFHEMHSFSLHKSDMEKGRSFMEQCAPAIAKIFPETAGTGGRIFSPLKEIKRFRTFINHEGANDIAGRFFLKCDNELPVAGSIKARGGFFEILKFAHRLATKENLANPDGSVDFLNPRLKEIFSSYTIGVGSTGNLGLSIGIISAQLGFNVNVFMSRDARSWKKDLLRKKGARVIEEKGDFTIAVTKGRRETHLNPSGYFVDDEKSSKLFLGYSLAAFELQKQLTDLHIPVDQDHPLFVYSPCGIGGSPGGVMFGLKELYGDAVHCFFAEPTHAPCVLIGLITEKKERVSVQDFGIDNLTEADGLAVGRPSAFASPYIHKHVSGIYTINDDALFKLMQGLYKTENIFVEPSAAAGLAGPQRILSTSYCRDHQINPAGITHVAWATGGSLMPVDKQKELLNRETAIADEA